MFSYRNAQRWADVERQQRLIAHGYVLMAQSMERLRQASIRGDQVAPTSPEYRPSVFPVAGRQKPRP